MCAVHASLRVYAVIFVKKELYIDLKFCCLLPNWKTDQFSTAGSSRTEHSVVYCYYRNATYNRVLWLLIIRDCFTMGAIQTRRRTAGDAIYRIIYGIIRRQLYTKVGSSCVQKCRRMDSVIFRARRHIGVLIETDSRTVGLLVPRTSPWDYTTRYAELAS